MTDPSGERTVRLRGILPQTASSASVRPDGSLLVEIYDWSAAAEQWLGREAAYFMILAPPEKARVLAELGVDVGAGSLEGSASPTTTRSSGGLTPRASHTPGTSMAWPDRGGFRCARSSHFPSSPDGTSCAAT